MVAEGHALQTYVLLALGELADNVQELFGVELAAVEGSVPAGDDLRVPLGAGGLNGGMTRHPAAGVVGQHRRVAGGLLGRVALLSGV